MPATQEYKPGADIKFGVTVQTLFSVSKTKNTSNEEIVIRIKYPHDNLFLGLIVYNASIRQKYQRRFRRNCHFGRAAMQ